MIRRPPRSTPQQSSAASDVYKRQVCVCVCVCVCACACVCFAPLRQFVDCRLNPAPHLAFLFRMRQGPICHASYPKLPPSYRKRAVSLVIITWFDLLLTDTPAPVTFDRVRITLDKARRLTPSTFQTVRRSTDQVKVFTSVMQLLTEFLRVIRDTHVCAD